MDKERHWRKSRRGGRYVLETRRTKNTFSCGEWPWNNTREVAVRSHQKKHKMGREITSRYLTQCFASHLTNSLSKTFVRLIYFKNSTFLSLKVFVYTDWCNERNIATPLVEMNMTELDGNLVRFYVQARTKKMKSTAVQLFLAFVIQLNDRPKQQWCHTENIKKSCFFKGATKSSTRSSESTAALAKKMFNTNQLLKRLTLLEFQPARSSAWQFMPGYWEERGFTFLSTGADVEERASEIFAATVLS